MNRSLLKIKQYASGDKYLFSSHLKKNEMAQGRGWPKAGYLSRLLSYNTRKTRVSSSHILRSNTRKKLERERERKRERAREREREREGGRERERESALVKRTRDPTCFYITRDRGRFSIVHVLRIFHHSVYQYQFTLSKFQ